MGWVSHGVLLLPAWPSSTLLISLPAPPTLSAYMVMAMAPPPPYP